jgi:hypothetical protein
MRLEITIGPPLLTVNQGHTVLACEPTARSTTVPTRVCSSTILVS